MNTSTSYPAEDAFAYSVVIPAFNRRRFLEHALSSVFAQTLPPCEVIVVDDGSSDGTAAWLAEAFPHVTAIVQPNRGVSAARNVGIQIACAPWIALLDSDDRWLPEKIQRQAEALAEHPDSRICHTEERWIVGGSERAVPKKYRKRNGWIFQACLERCAVAPSSVLAQRELLLQAGGFDETLPACEDYDLWLRLAVRDPFLLVNEALTEKRAGHADQLSNQRGLDEFRILAIQKLLDTGVLSRSQESAARQILVAKATILASGAAKSGRPEAAAGFWQIVRDHRPS